MQNFNIVPKFVLKYRAKFLYVCTKLKALLTTEIQSDIVLYCRIEFWRKWNCNLFCPFYSEIFSPKLLHLSTLAFYHALLSG